MNSSAIASRKWMPAAVAAALAGPMAHAADSPTLEVYGRAHVTVDYLDNGDEARADVSSNSSRIGFRAATEIQPGLKARAQIEQEVRFDNGPGSNTDTNAHFASRDTFIALQSDTVGGLRLGYFDTPLKAVRSAVDFFNDQIGDARNVTRLPGNLFDNRFRNGINYTTPSFAGFQADIDYSTNNGTASTPPATSGEAVSGSVTYRASALYAAVSYEKYQINDAKAMRAAASYKVGGATLAALYQHATRVVGGSDTDADTYGVGASYKLGDSAVVKAQYYQLSDDLDEADASLLAVGADYLLSQQFRLLFVYAMTGNDDNAAYGMSAGGHGDAVALNAPGDTASGFSAGFRYDF
jgi:predicted porin